MIKHVIWASMIDYPGFTSTVLFTGNCNFKCDYCYNKSLKGSCDMDFQKTILPKLIQRKDFVDHVILSGGEPTVYADFEEMVDVLYKNGFHIGVHTNGSNPDKIERVLEKIEYLGIDIKTVFEKYNVVTGIVTNVENVKKTIKLAINSGKQYELRTTLFPRDVSMEDVITIAKWLKEEGANKYHLQQFYPVNGAFNIKSYSLEEITNMQQECNKIIPTILKTK